MADSETEQRVLRSAFSAYPTGVMALAAELDGEPVGMTVNSFSSISLDPPLVAVSVARTSRTWPRLARAAELGMSVLAADHETLSRQFSARDGDRFAGYAWQRTEAGALLLDGAALWLRCSVHSRLDGGDHEIILCRIVDATVFEDVEPLVFHQSRYRTMASEPVGVGR